MKIAQFIPMGEVQYAIGEDGKVYKRSQSSDVIKTELGNEKGFSDWALYTELPEPQEIKDETYTKKPVEPKDLKADPV